MRHFEGGHVRREFAALLVVLAEGYPTVRLGEGTFRRYAQLLDELTLEEVAAAFQRAAKECRFFPTVADVLAASRGTVDDRALVAWSVFQQAAKDVGSWGSLDVEDGAAADAFRLVFGGWPEYCALDGPAVGARRQEFLAAYRAAARTAPAGTRRLPGQVELDGGRAPVRHLGVGAERLALPEATTCR